jgi:hypothetical protein
MPRCVRREQMDHEPHFTLHHITSRHDRGERRHQLQYICILSFIASFVLCCLERTLWSTYCLAGTWVSEPEQDSERGELYSWDEVPSSPSVSANCSLELGAPCRDRSRTIPSSSRWRYRAWPFMRLMDECRIVRAALTTDNACSDDVSSDIHRTVLSGRVIGV